MLSLLYNILYKVVQMVFFHLVPEGHIFFKWLEQPLKARDKSTAYTASFCGDIAMILERAP